MPSILLDGGQDKNEVNTLNPNTQQEQDEVSLITERVNEMYDLQRRTWSEFNDRSLTDYIDDNEKRINNYVEPRGEDIEDWQTRSFEGITREKMFAFVSKVAMQRPRYTFRATRKDGFIDKTMAEVVEDFYDYSWVTEDPSQIEFFNDAWAAAGNGTVIRWEGVEQFKEVLEDFDEYDVTTGEIKGLTSKTTTTDVNCKARRVRLQDFLISDWYEPDIQRQPAVAETRIMSRQQFERTFGHYKNADKIPKLSDLKANRSQNPTFFMRQWDAIQEEKVHVTFFFSKEDGKSKFRIVANGILILATPIPRKDGKFPYGRGIFKPFADASYFYGKALPDEIAHDQDMYNAFKNMVLDRSILHIQRPMIGNNLTEVDDTIMRPNAILNFKGDVKTLDIQPASGGDLQILEYLRNAADRQTSDSQQSGQTGSGVTAREIVIADENARKLAGVFRLFLEAFDIQCAKLRIGNILQFYFQPTLIDEILKGEEAEDVKIAYRTIVLDKKMLSNQRSGTKVVSIVGSTSELPSQEELDIQESMAKMQGFEMEKLSISADYVRNFQVDVMVIPESSFEQSRSLELAMQNEYLDRIAMLFPQKFQQFQETLFRELNDVYNKDMTEFEQGEQAAPMMGAQAPQPEAGSPGQSIGQQLTNAGSPSLGQMAGMSI